MKLKEFLDNPVGKGDSSLNRAALRSMLDKKYDDLLKNKPDQIKTKIYHKLNSDEYFIHLEIPTETKRDNSYDVVLYFYPIDKTKASSLLNTHELQFFCNAPSFAYTFAKVYDNEGLLIPSLKNKFPDEIFGSNPEVRNRYGIVNYDKYLYFGCKYVLESRLLNRGTLPLKSINYTATMLNQKVRTLDKIMMDYRKAERKLKDESKKQTHPQTTGAKVKSTVKNTAVKVIQKKTPNTTSHNISKKGHVQKKKKL